MEELEVWGLKRESGGLEREIWRSVLGSYYGNCRLRGVEVRLNLVVNIGAIMAGKELGS